MKCVSEGCTNTASVLAYDPDDRKVLLPLCQQLTCAPLAVASGFVIRPMPERKRAA